MVVWEGLIEYTLIYAVKAEIFRRVLIVFWMRSLEFACHLVNDQLDSSSDLVIAHSLAIEKNHDVAQAIT